MRDLLGVTLSLVLPWVAGTLAVAALQSRARERDWLLCAGYGYPIGAFATTLVLRAVSLLAPHWGLWLVAVPLGLLAIGAFLLARSGEPWNRAATRSRHVLGAMPASLRALFWIAVALIAVRLAGLAAEVALRPLLPFDAWTQWSTKALVWYHYGRIVPFVSPEQWLSTSDPMRFVDSHSGYPGTVPLLQVWTALCLGRWDESLINAPWPALACALGLAFYAQVRRLGVSPALAALCTYLLMSLPFLDVQVALAGCADLYMAVAYGLAAMALWQWSLAPNRSDALLALTMAVVASSLKTEGILWVLTLLPPVLVSIHRRAGLAAVACIAGAALLYVFFGPPDLEIFAYILHTRFSNVSQPLLEHMFLMDNWHLLWYLAIAMVAVNYRILLSPALAPMSVTLLGGLAFVFVVFFFTSAAGGVEDESLVNRLPLHLVPALAFYLVLVWRVRLRRVSPEAADSASPPKEGDAALAAGATGESLSIGIAPEREACD